MVYIILGKGFEETEAIVPCDLLRRAGVETRFAGIGAREITGSHGITVQADCTVEEMERAEMLVLPGGMQGVASICGSESALSAVRAQYESGGFVAAICAAPTVLAELGILRGRKATCYPGMEGKLDGAEVCAEPAVRDGTVITGRAAGAAFDFGLALVEALRGKRKAREIAAGIVFCKNSEKED